MQPNELTEFWLFFSSALRGFPCFFFVQFYSPLCSNEKDTITWNIHTRKRGLQWNYNHSSSYLGLSCSRWCQLCDGTTQMIKVKMVIGLLAFEERAESLLRRGFIIVPWETTCFMFFQPPGIQAFGEIKWCGFFLFGPSSFITRRKQKAVIYIADNCCILCLD